MDKKYILEIGKLGLEAILNGRTSFIKRLERHIESSSTNPDYCKRASFIVKYRSFLNGEPTSVFDYSPDDYSDHYKSYFVYDGDCYRVSDNVHRDWMKCLEF